jgi:hypothetical protein
MSYSERAQEEHFDREWKSDPDLTPWVTAPGRANENQIGLPERVFGALGSMNE